jgi:4-alpha-glucanotransferase
MINMSDQNAGSASTQESSGSTETNPNDKVAYDTYRRVLAEAKKLKDQVKLYEEEKTKSHEQKLKEQNEWKALAEAKSAQADHLEKAFKEQQEQIVNGMKYQEFEKHLGGRLKNRDYATFIDFDKIVINPETKQIDAESVKGVVSGFVKEHSSLVEFSGSARMPNEAAKSAAFGTKPVEKMTPAELREYIIEQAKNGNLK